VLLGSEAETKRLVTTVERANALLARFDKLAAAADTQLFGKEGVVPEARARWRRSPARWKKRAPAQTRR